MTHTDCQILFEAGKVLLTKSGLAHYSGRHFVACNDERRFEEYWKTELHPEFGRYMAWILFSVGAENLAKAACVCSGILSVGNKPTLRDYLSKHFKDLCYETGLGGSDGESKLIGGYEQLKDIRNRDAHSYHKNVREANFPLVDGEFIPAFNILVKVLTCEGHARNKF